ncbi:hypothetical protein LCGC14_1501430 [marine sediment metagenome]|uniref:Uncharacterized protein n=1 Tax=marine sediment metagenome TaxID=412755 RepID=A0A0F9M5E7_9ZZZZ
MGQDRNRMQQEYEAINTNWNTKAEAAFFFQMVSDDTISFEQVQRDILMRPEQLAWLCKTFPFDAPLLKQIFRRRCRTYKDFLFLCAHPERAQTFREAVYPTAGAA